MSHYILRFDDITPGMNWENFLKIKNIATSYNIKSILGVVPENRDPKLSPNQLMCETEFFNKLKDYDEYGDTIAQHGTYHLYTTANSGILNINNKSEFAGYSYEEQKNKLLIGKKILQQHDIWQPYFMAPSHSFDINTLKALKALGFEAVTDGYGLYPYDIEGITLVPQLVGKPIKLIPFGVQTICLHTNSMNDRAIDSMIKFLNANHKQFINFKDALNLEPKLQLSQNITFLVSKYSLRMFRKVLSKLN